MNVGIAFSAVEGAAIFEISPFLLTMSATTAKL